MFSKSRPQAALSNQQQAQLTRNRSLLDDEIMESEKRLKAMARGQLGNASLLAGRAKPASQAPAASLISGSGYKPMIGDKR